VALYAVAGFGGVVRRVSKKFCTCRLRLSSYDNSSACVAMWFKLRSWEPIRLREWGWIYWT